jgi:uncharacterized protein (DUF849 family)
MHGAEGDRVMLIKAAINGGRMRSEHAAVPVKPEEQAADVVACIKGGAGAVHLHVRSTLGDDDRSAKESLEPQDVARTLLVVRSVCESIGIAAPVGISTGAWILPDTVRRLEVVTAWDVLPDFASVNFSEDGAVELASILLSRGVEVEAGLSDAEAATVFVKSGLAAKCIRVLLEPQEQEMQRALETVGAMEQLIDTGLPHLPPLLLHGTEATVWPMMDEAIRRGYDVRVGLEDTLILPDGRIAKDNVELVTEAVRRKRTTNPTRH